MARLSTLVATLLSVTTLLPSFVHSSSCPTTYDSSIDYFASSTSQWYPTNAQTFSVSYHRYYKRINITAPGDGSGKSTIITLRMCGSPAVPLTDLTIDNLNNVNVVQLELPLQRTALLSTTQIPWVEMLAERSTITAIYGSELVYSSCVRQGLTTGSIVDVKLPDWSYDTTLLTSKADAVFCSAGPYGCPGTTLDIPVADNYEQSVLGVSEYVGFFSLFYNQENKARAILNDIRNRYTCQVAQQNEILPSLNRPKVLWAYIYQGTWTVGSCPNYYCELIKDAGGQLLTMTVPGTGPYGTYTTNEIASLISQADIWLFTGDTWASDIVTSTDPVLVQAMNDSPAVKSRRVYDLQKASTNAWFETRVAQPDAVLQDIASIITPKMFDDNNYQRIWFRNVYSENIASLPSATTCTDVSQPFILQSRICPLSTLSNALNTNTNNDNTVLGTGAIAGIAAGAVAATVLVIGIVIMIVLKTGIVTSTLTSVSTIAATQPGASSTTTISKDTNTDGTFTLRTVVQVQ